MKANKVIEKVATTTKDLSKSLSDLEKIVLALRTVTYVNKISKGIITEAKALSNLEINAKIVLGCEAVTLGSEAILWGLKKYEEHLEKKLKEAAIEEKSEPVVEDDFTEVKPEPATT